MSDLAERVGLYAVGKLAVPAIVWVGSRLFRGPIGVGKGLLLGAVGLGTTIIVSIKPEESLDFVLRQVANVANLTGNALGVAANQIRALEKVDLEELINRPLRYFDDRVHSRTNGIEVQPLLIAAPPPLLPKDYTVENFPYYGGNKRLINDPDVDPYLEAYYTLGIDIVSMILNDHQLPQLSLVRDIYLQRVKQVHPDKNPQGDHQLTASLNDSYTKIKAMMNSADDQFDILSPVLQAFHKGSFPAYPYILLFFAGGFFTIWLVRG